MSDELRPCPNPWCNGGSFPSLEQIFGLSYHVTCLGCGIHSTPRDTPEEARESWNTRPVEDELRAENERLRKLARGLCRRYRPARSEAAQADGDFWALSRCTDEARLYIERLREALEPFTKWSTMFPHGVPGDLARGMINLRCGHCGNAMRVPRQLYDPPAAVELETNGCNICNASLGGFGLLRYYDSAGAEISADPGEQETNR